MLAEHALADQAQQLRLEGQRGGDVILQMVGRPAIAGGGVPRGGAGMDGERQAVPLGRRPDRPEQPLAQRHVAHGQHHHLHEARIAGAALDFRHRQLGALGGDDDGGAQPLLAVEPFGGDPVVQRAGQRRGQVFVAQPLDAVQAVENGRLRAETVEHMRAQRGQIGAGPAAAGRAPVGAAMRRRAGGETHQVEPVDAAHHDLRAPVIVEIGQQSGHAGQRRMHVAIDAAEGRSPHVTPLPAAAGGYIRLHRWAGAGPWRDFRG